MKNPLQHAHFLRSVPDPSGLPEDNGHEVAFVGRSNAGKSSALNALTGQKALARTSKTPGRTQHLVVFALDPERRLIDLPGYGYAKVARNIQNRWVQAMDNYLQSRESLRGLVLLVDVRHLLKDTDSHLLQWATDCRLPVLILLTKADKLSRGQGQNQYLKLKRLLDQDHPLASAQLFSAKTGLGLEQARSRVATWLALELTEG